MASQRQKVQELNRNAKSQTEMLKTRTALKIILKSLVGSDLTELRKESITLKIGHKKLPMLKLTRNLKKRVGEKNLHK